MDIKVPLSTLLAEFGLDGGTKQTFVIRMPVSRAAYVIVQKAFDSRPQASCKVGFKPQS